MSINYLPTTQAQKIFDRLYDAMSYACIVSSDEWKSIAESLKAQAENFDIDDDLQPSAILLRDFAAAMDRFLLSTSQNK